jgi:glycolate oxidase
MDSGKFIKSLAKIYPGERCLTGPAELIPYESDSLTAYQQRPLAVVLPETQQEAIDTMRLCFKMGVPFVPRGSGTSLSGGSLPVDGGIVVAMNRLNRIVEINPRNRTAQVECGVVNLAVSNAAQEYGLYFAPDPSSQPICTIGGNLAFNSGGAHCLKYGMTGNHILGIKAVLPDGEVVEIGGDSLEHVGPDLVGLYVGTEGLFGIALEATLRLMPRPQVFKTVLAAYSSMKQAGDAVSAVISAGLLPGAIEIMDRLAVQAAEAAVEANYPKNAEVVLIVELEGEENQVAQELIQLSEVIDGSEPVEVRVARNADERMLIWKGRKSAFSAVGRLSPDYIVQDGVVPRSSLGDTLQEISLLSEKYGVPIANVFHAGDGNLHPLILYDGTEAEAYETAEEIAHKILELCVTNGGSITGEHGIGVEKLAAMPIMFSPEEIQTFSSLRAVIDPLGLSNPGKMLVQDRTL